jgi:transposase
VQKRAELLVHLQNTNSQYNLPEIGKKLAYKANRAGVAEHFPDPSVRKTIEVEVSLIAHYDQLLSEVELSIPRTAKLHDVQTFARLQSVPEIGQILALVILYEIQDIHRFPRVQDFVSVVLKCRKESTGKRQVLGKKIINVYLCWRLPPPCLLPPEPTGKEYFTKLERNHGKAKAPRSWHPLARAVYYMLTREQAFDLQRFVSATPVSRSPSPNWPPTGEPA